MEMTLIWLDYKMSEVEKYRYATSESRHVEFFIIIVHIICIILFPLSSSNSSSNSSTPHPLSSFHSIFILSTTPFHSSLSSSSTPIPPHSMARAKSISTSPSPKISPRKLPLSHVPPNSLSVVNGSAPKNIQSRPPLRNNFDLEPNPFEQSFATSGSTSRPSLSSIRDNASTDDHPQHPKSFNSPNESNIRQKSPSASSTSSSHHSRKLSTESISNGNHPPTSNETPKPILPPLAAITSPSEQSYSWAFSTGLANSLRSGPLSPAMLTGPQQPQQQSASTSALFSFDPSGAFRTGLTPSTGLTPLVGGPVAFPPPSPNTAAAFYAIVNNGPAGTGQNSSTITPGTLNAYASVLQGASAPAVSVNNGSQSSSTAGASAAASVNGSAAAGSTITSAIPAAFEGSSSQASRYTSSYPQSGTQSQNKSHANHDQSSSSYASDNSSTSAAANGLFLLSQAHQELTKREEAQKQNQSQQGQTQSLVNGKRGSKRKSDAASTASSTTAPVSSVKSLPPSSKRSRVTSQAPSSVNTRTASARRGSAAASLSTGDGDDDLDVDEDEEDYDPMEGDLGSMRDKDKDRLPTSQSQSGAQKKPETEEEKRKNFLERNRQGAHQSF